MFMFVDYCVEWRSSDRTQNISKDFWKPYLKILFILSGHNKEFKFSWQEFRPRPRLGSRGATAKPCGRMLEVFKEGDYTNQIEDNGLPWPHRECIVGLYVKTCMFKKNILKIRKFCYAGRDIVRIFLPLPPPPTARRDMWSLIWVGWQF